MFPFLSEKSGGVRLQIHVQPNAKQNAIVGRHGEALKIKIKAPPEDGKANAALIIFLAEVFGISRQSVTVEAGLSSRSKAVLISGIDLAFARSIVQERLLDD